MESPTNHHSQSPAAEEMDISNTNLCQNIPPKKSTQPLEDNVDDPASPPVQPRKKGKVGTRKRLPESVEYAQAHTPIHTISPPLHHLIYVHVTSRLDPFVCLYKYTAS